MVRDSILSLVSSPHSQVRIDRSRCLRMRYNRSSCARCVSACPSGAIALDGGISLDAGKCTGCMLCTSACPVDALEIKGFDFQRAAAELGKAESPVLGCMHKEGLLAHAKTPCLGFLSTEHLVFLLSFMDGGIQFNLTECRECENGLILDKLSDVVASVGRTVPGMAPRLRALYEKDELEFQEVSLSRRGFFRLLRGATVEGVSCVAEEFSRTEKSQPYGSKKIPGKRELLNRACRKFGTVDGDLLTNCFTVKVDDACNACAACAAMCPNGALKCGREGETKALSFNASRCSGCGLCEEFCMHNAIELGSGHDGIGLVEFVSVTTGSCVEVEQGNAA